MFDLTGRIAVLTGGSGNLGPIWRKTLEDAGAKVFIIDQPSYTVISEMSLENAREDCVKNFGVPDIIVNNAAYDPKPSQGGGKFWDYNSTIDINLKGALNVCKVFTDIMIGKGGGVIVNIGSIMGNIGSDWRNYPEGFDKAVGYNVSKAALIQLSRSICTQYGKDNMRSVTISFGPYDSGLPEDFKSKFLKNVPLGRTISKESLQRTLLYACCCEELSGQQILVDAGYTSF